MPQPDQFVLAFGGTGARCAEALTYLLASRVVDRPTHVLLVDPDENNGNVTDARQQLQRYLRVQAALDTSAGLEQSVGDLAARPFFSTTVNPPDDAAGPAAPSPSVFWQYPNTNQNFGTLIDRAALPSEEQDLLNLLYDDDDFRLSFSNGYVGRAHIGSLDLLRTLRQALVPAGTDAASTQQDDALLTFARRLRAAAMSQDGAKLVVLGSIFGGTGASGIPAVPPLLDGLFAGQPGLRKKVKVGCVQMAPYFTFPKGQPGDPDSALHPLATQSALYHYAYTEVGYDRIYLVGAPQRPATSDENSRGGNSQHNAPHHAELGAALATAHFFGTPPAGGTVEVVACGSRVVDWSGLPNPGSPRLQGHLVAFTAACALHARFLHDDIAAGKLKGARWMYDLVGKDAARSLSKQDDKEALDALNAFAQRYLTWVREVQGHRDVGLFGFRDDPARPMTAEALGAIVDVPGGDPGTPVYHTLMSTLDGTGPQIRQRTGAGWYVDAITRAADRLARTHYRLN